MESPFLNGGSTPLTSVVRRRSREEVPDGGVVQCEKDHTVGVLLVHNGGPRPVPLPVWPGPRGWSNRFRNNPNGPSNCRGSRGKERELKGNR